MAPLSQTSVSVAQRCETLREQGFEFIVLAAEPGLSKLELNPFGVNLQPVSVADENPLGWSTTSFAKLFHSMDTHVFGSRGLTMPNWVLVDHALLSSGLVTLACLPEAFEQLADLYQLSDDETYVLSSLAVEAADLGFDGPIPLASYCAAPTASPGARVGWSLCSVVPGGGLGFIVKALGLASYRANTLIGTTQYDNLALRIHTKFGALRLVAATMQAHSAPHTFVYESNFKKWLDNLPHEKDDSKPTFLLSPGDTARQEEMQRRIYAGTHEYFILPPGVIVADGSRLVPVFEQCVEGEKN